MKHHLAQSEHLIIGGSLLFLCLVALFVIDAEWGGKATTGNADSTVLIVPSAPRTCAVYAGAGYNLISVSCMNTSTLVTDLFENATVTAMYQYVPGDPDLWRVYNPNLPSYVVSDLQYMTRRVGYVAIMGATYNTTLEGTQASLSSIPLVSGWNLVGYPSNITRNATDAFSTMSVNATIILAYNKSTESFISYPGGGLDTVTDTLGYWVNATGAGTWTVTS
jgi:hypothetical protein